jgi:hypothetical protein
MFRLLGNVKASCYRGNIMLQAVHVRYCSTVQYFAVQHCAYTQQLAALVFSALVC